MGTGEVRSIAGEQERQEYGGRAVTYRGKRKQFRTILPFLKHLSKHLSPFLEASRRLATLYGERTDDCHVYLLHDRLGSASLGIVARGTVRGTTTIALVAAAIRRLGLKAVHLLPTRMRLLCCESAFKSVRPFTNLWAWLRLGGARSCITIYGWTSLAVVYY